MEYSRSLNRSADRHKHAAGGQNYITAKDIAQSYTPIRGVHVCVRVCVRACVRVRVLDEQHTEILSYMPT